MATSTLNPSEISELIKTRIEKVKLAAEARNEGTVTSVSDGIVRIHGLADVMQGEMIELPGNSFALALNLEHDSVGAVVLGEYQHLREGDTAKTTGRILEVPVGPELVLFSQDDRHFYYGEQPIPTDQIMAVRVLINGSPIESSVSTRWPAATRWRGRPDR